MAASLASLTLAATANPPLVKAGEGNHAERSDQVAAGSPAALGVVKVRGVRVADVDNSHLRVAVEMTITPVQKATLVDLRLTSLRLNGLPAFAEPLTEQIELIPEKETTLAPMYITMQFRDLTTAVERPSCWAVPSPRSSGRSIFFWISDPGSSRCAGDCSG